MAHSLCLITAFASGEIFLRHSFEWGAGENNLLRCLESNTLADTMKFAHGWAKITSGNSNFKRSIGCWYFTNNQKGNFAWAKINSNGEKYKIPQK